MILHYSPAAPTATLPSHYRPINTDTTSHTLHKSRPFLSTPTSLPQPPLTSAQPSMPITQSHLAAHNHSSQSSQSNDTLLMLDQVEFGDSWGTGASATSGFLQTLPQRTSGLHHKRLSSGSSITSNGPPSPYDHSSPYVQIANDSSSYLPDHPECMSTPPQHHIPKSLPTPVGTPTSSTFMPIGYQNALALRRMRSGNFDDDSSSFVMSGAQSASSMSHNSPATPHTNFEHELDEKHIARGEGMRIDQAGWMDSYVPVEAAFPPSAAYSQTMADLFPERPMQNFAQQAQPNIPHTSSNLSPYRNVNMNLYNERLQAASREVQRTSSPATSVTDRMPFKFATSTSSPRDHKQSLTQPMAQSHMTSSKSVSPKELLLEDPQGDEDTSSLFAGQYDSSMSGYSNNAGFYGNQVPQQFYMNSRRRQASGSVMDGDQLPDFPAHMVSMETTVEEGPSDSSQQSTSQPPSRPANVSSDSGTYTCTYHGCSLRFDSPARLQKHKREGHRQGSPSAAPSAGAAAVNIALRNSQAGPHKCERINPSTGKPCSSIFSRPYDLTRHEDTIHNARKPKVRCHLCNEEKTFSRNDALTRHMRVVHPDVNWPGKTRRGKGRS